MTPHLIAVCDLMEMRVGVWHSDRALLNCELFRNSAMTSSSEINIMV